VGEILNTLDRLGLAANTLVVFSSDNGAYVIDESGHHPNGPWRGEKSQLWEGGHRVPFIARWPGQIVPGVSSELVCLVDLPATAAALVGKSLAAADAPDSFDLLPIFLGKTNPHSRDHLIVMSGKGDLAIRQGPWKYIPDLATADGWSARAPKPGAKPAGAGLFQLTDDPRETNNLNGKNPDVSKRLTALLEKYKAAGSSRPQ